MFEGAHDFSQLLGTPSVFTATAALAPAVPILPMFWVRGCLAEMHRWSQVAEVFHGFPVFFKSSLRNWRLTVWLLLERQIPTYNWLLEHFRHFFLQLVALEASFGAETCDCTEAFFVSKVYVQNSFLLGGFARLGGCLFWPMRKEPMRHCRGLSEPNRINRTSFWGSIKPRRSFLSCPNITHKTLDYRALQEGDWQRVSVGVSVPPSFHTINDCSGSPLSRSRTDKMDAEVLLSSQRPQR